VLPHNRVSKRSNWLW